jgi:hypothetical protein
MRLLKLPSWVPRARFSRPLRKLGGNDPRGVPATRANIPNSTHMPDMRQCSVRSRWRRDQVILAAPTELTGVCARQHSGLRIRARLAPRSRLVGKAKGSAPCLRPRLISSASRNAAGISRILAASSLDRSLNRFGIFQPGISEIEDTIRGARVQAYSSQHRGCSSLRIHPAPKATSVVPLQDP